MFKPSVPLVIPSSPQRASEASPLLRPTINVTEENIDGLKLEIKVPDSQEQIMILNDRSDSTDEKINLRLVDLLLSVEAQNFKKGANSQYRFADKILNNVQIFRASKNSCQMTVSIDLKILNLFQEVILR